MNFYEAVFIVDPEWENGDLGRMEKMVEEQVTKAGGDIHELINQGRQRLAYPIQKRNHGCYFLVRFKAEPSQLSALSAGMKLTPAVIRHLVVRLKGPFGPVAGAAGPEEEKAPVPAADPGPPEKEENPTA